MLPNNGLQLPPASRSFSPLVAFWHTTYVTSGEAGQGWLVQLKPDPLGRLFHRTRRVMETLKRKVVLLNVSPLVLFGAMALSGAGYAQESSNIPETRLEVFATEPGTETTWSRFIAKLDGRVAYAIVSAVMMESQGPESTTMRGVRIELRHEGSKPSCDLIYREWAAFCERDSATVFIEELRLDEIRQSVLDGSAEIHPGHPAGISRYGHGGGVSGAAGGGVILFGYGLEGRTMEEISSALGSAIAALETAPR